MPPVLLKDQSISFLSASGLMLIQNRRDFCLGEDGVALAAFGRACPGERVLEFGTGFGGVLFLAYDLCGDAYYTGLDIVFSNIELCKKSLALNAENFSAIKSRLNFIEQDIRLLPAELRAGAYDRVLCNPPYFCPAAGRLSPNPQIAAAKWEIFCDLDDVFGAAARMLKKTGELDLVLPLERVDEAVALAAKNGFFAIRRQKLLNQDGQEMRELWAWGRDQNQAECKTLLPLAAADLHKLWF
jgi:tRNA1Val (adenine37-N6)-methyltransferase